MMRGGPINPLIIRVIINNLNQNQHHKDDESTLGSLNTKANALFAHSL